MTRLLQKKITGQTDLFFTLAGITTLFATFLYAYGVFFDLSNLVGYNIGNLHRYTARALLEGKLYFPFHFRYGETLDLQFYNGAFFTNWGYGIPLLQLPFHVLSNLGNHSSDFHFFSDRLIFIFYFLFALVFFYSGMKRLFFDTLKLPVDIRSHASLFILCLAVYTFALFPVCSLTNRVYEETMGYMLLLQLLATGFFLFFHSTGKARWLVVAAITAAFCILIRPTALVYYGIWFLLFAFRPGQIGVNKRIRNGLLFILVSAPLLVSWCAFN